MSIAGPTRLPKDGLIQSKHGFQDSAFMDGGSKLLACGLDRYSVLTIRINLNSSVYRNPSLPILSCYSRHILCDPAQILAPSSVVNEQCHDLTSLFSCFQALLRLFPPSNEPLSNNLLVYLTSSHLYLYFRALLEHSL